MQKDRFAPHRHIVASLQLSMPEYDDSMLSDDAIDKFIDIYEKKYQEPISRADATVMATRLVDLYRVLLQPIPPEKMKEFLEMDFPSETSE